MLSIPTARSTISNPKDTRPTTVWYNTISCAFTLYEDEGTDYNYENGDCSTIKFSFNDETGELTIGERFGTYEGMTETRPFNIVWASKKTPVGFDPEKTPRTTIKYDGARTEVKNKN